MKVKVTIELSRDVEFESAEAADIAQRLDWLRLVPKFLRDNASELGQVVDLGGTVCVGLCSDPKEELEAAPEK